MTGGATPAALAGGWLTPTAYGGVPALRAAFSNWRTTPADVNTAWRSMLEVAEKLE